MTPGEVNASRHSAWQVVEASKIPMGALLRLFEELPPFSAWPGLPLQAKRRFLQAVSLGPDACTCVAVLQDNLEPIGYLIVVTHVARFWLAVWPVSLRIALPALIRRLRNCVGPGYQLYRGALARGGEKSGRVLRVAVLPAFRGSGVASALYDFVKAILARQGISTLETMISPQNTASLALHKRSGWAMKIPTRGYVRARLPVGGNTHKDINNQCRRGIS